MVNEAGRENALKARIMRRVRAVWFLKSVAPLLAVEVVLASGVLVGVLSQISISQIFANAFQASSGVRDFVQFFIDNFLVKSVQSRLLAVLYLAFVMLFARDLRRSLRRLRAAGPVAFAAALRS